MLKFIKKFFAKEPEPISVSKEKLPEFIGNKLQGIDFSLKKQDYIKQIGDIKTRLTEKAESLLQQTVSEKDQKEVEMRVQNIVSGHKNNYAREIVHFARDLGSLENIDSDIIAFDNNLQEKLDNLSRKTAKSFEASKYLFFDPVEEVRKILIELNNYLREFEKIKEKILKVDSLKKLLEDRLDEKRKVETVYKQKEEILEKKKKMNSELEELEKKKEELLESENYKNLQDDKNKLEKIKIKLQNINQETHSFFAKLSKPLKKYERVSLQNKLIGKYLADSGIALENDSELEIKKIIEKMKDADIDVDYKVKEKIEQSLKIMLGGFLEKQQNDVMKVNNSIKEMQQKIKANKVSEEIKHVENDIKMQQTRIENLKIPEIHEAFDYISKMKEIAEEVFKIKIELVDKQEKS